MGQELRLIAILRYRGFRAIQAIIPGIDKDACTFEHDALTDLWIKPFYFRPHISFGRIIIYPTSRFRGHGLGGTDWIKIIGSEDTIYMGLGICDANPLRRINRVPENGLLDVAQKVELLPNMTPKVCALGRKMAYISDCKMNDALHSHD